MFMIGHVPLLWPLVLPCKGVLSFLKCIRGIQVDSAITKSAFDVRPMVHFVMFKADMYHTKSFYLPMNECFLIIFYSRFILNTQLTEICVPCCCHMSSVGLLKKINQNIQVMVFLNENYTT